MKRFLYGITLLYILQITNISFANILENRNVKKYPGIILGKVVNKKVVKSNGYYLTEYKVKVLNWLYFQKNIEKAKNITIKILGADLSEKGIAMKVSTAPSYIPYKKDAIFFLEYNKLRRKNVYTLSTDGVVFGKNKYREEISEINNFATSKEK